MHHYTVQNGDSPHSIARRFGIHVRQLIAANPNKPVVNVSGQQTWSALYPGERLRIPHRHEFLSPQAQPSYAPPQAPWWQQQQQWQQPWQQQQQWQPPPPPPSWQQQQIPQQPYNPGRFRFGPRGVHGVGTVLAGHRYEEELRRLREGRRGYEYGGMPYGVADAGLGDAGSDAVQALLAAGDPCDPNNTALVCAVQAALGIGADGKWGAGTAKAAQAVFPGAPGACTPRPSWWAPAGQSNCGAAPPALAPSAAPMVMPPLIIPTASLPAGSVPADPSGPPPVVPPAAPSAAPAAPPSSAPPAVLAMASIDPCSAANVGAVCAAQAALGLQPDGKWGAATAHAASLAMPNAPPACTPRPGWWAPKGQSNCGGAAPTPHAHGGFAPPAPGGAPPAPGGAPPAYTPASVLPGGIVGPKGGAHTMAVAGVVGAVALAGIVALVATGNHQKIITRYRARRAPAPAPAPHRAPARRSPRRLKRR
jgi:hypothetical protein